MGFYINAGNENLKIALNSEIFVDKSLVLQKLCSLLNTQQRFICLSRPRRFGKTTVRDLMVAYFSKGCDSREMFSHLKIAKESCFEQNLNKFNVIAVDLGAIYNAAENKNDVLKNLKSKLLKDFRDEFPDVEFSDEDSIADMIMRVYAETKTQFIVIIDEYDTLIRERRSEAMLEEYRSFLNSIFKNNELSSAIALAYLTGILPIMRDKVQSKLNVFDEYTILAPAWTAEFFGFTKEEVKSLCGRYEMSYAECENWYDGYKIGEFDIYNPNSVVKAMMRREYTNYWNATGSYEVVADYIKLDFDGTKSAITDMLAGTEIKININKFENSLDKINSKDNVLTYLIHLGYVNYDKTSGLCRIPNKEIRQEWEKAIESAGNFGKIVKMIEDSEKLLKWTQEGDSERVAAALDNAHQTIADPLDYNDETSLKTAIILAYYTASSKYTIVKELPTGRGFADIGFIPKSPKDPAMVVELKCNSDADTAIKQIKNRNYPKVFENYLDNLLLVGVNYDKTTKVHECVIEKYQK
ncbi:AAA family ATPase [bacterium]|nr:AAA family ATPase [bacterium]